ncbi:uncharacterized protein [Watersipora subatra]|uniref:uncharacterized protein isoform X2 n=1 Tax=Watersipora subatra TaxID=2589382 RepID=UPI00355BD053
MSLLFFMASIWLLCFVWCIILILKLFNLEYGYFVSKVKETTTEISSKHVINEAYLAQLLPVSSARSWTLEGVINGHRVWHLTTAVNVHLYAVSLKVKSSAKNLLRLLGQPSLFSEWRPGITLISAASVSSNHGTQVVKWREKRLECKLIPEGSVMFWWLEPFLQTECTVRRIFTSGAKYPAIIEVNEHSGANTAFVCQPIIGLEKDQCRLTVITSGNVKKMTVECQCLSDHFVMMRATVDDCQQESETHNQQVSTEEDDTEAKGSLRSSKLPPDSQGFISTNQGDCKKSDPPDDVSFSQQELSISPNAQLEDHASGGGDNVVATPKAHTTGTDAYSGSDTPSDLSPSLETVSERKEHVEGYSSVIFVRTLNGQQGLIDYKTLSNTCAADLLAEVMAATSSARKALNKSETSTGWVLDSTDRDVAVLRKTSNSGSLRSWIGRGMIKESPEVVRQAVANPYSRYIYDEMLKDLTILSNLDDGLKLLKLNYSASQVLGKDSREFYLLQAERTEGKKRLVTLCSFQSPEPETKECPRGKFGTSGWIIEPVVSKNKHIYSMVTYLSQIDLGDLSTSGALQFDEDFVAKQPIAIAHLREYLTNK